MSGEKITSELRELKKLTQKEAARKLSTLKRIAQICDTSVGCILGVDNRKCVYLNGLSEDQQKIIIDFIDKIKPEMK